MARLNECILYRNFEHGEILEKMAELMNAWEQKPQGCMAFPEISGIVI